ncbi:MAG TPA: DinB family protein [Anaerolineales bacterium]
MILRVGIENNNDNRSIAWALEHPGCFGYGSDAQDAEVAMQQASREYAAWVRQHGMAWMDSDSVEVQVEETFDVYMAHPDPTEFPDARDYMVESFFHRDEQPLSRLELERAGQLLEWSRQDLLRTVKGLSPERLDQKYPGERWSINGILNHVAHGEWFYQERIGFPFPEREDDLPPEPLRALELVRAHFRAILPKLEGLDRVVELEGERWSPCKALRRATWHERDHTDHIRKLL